MTNRQKTILVGLALVAIIVFVVLGFLVFSRDVARDVKAVAFVATDIKPTASATTTAIVARSVTATLSPTPSSSPTVSPTPTPTLKLSPSPTVVPSSTDVPTPLPSSTLSYTATPSSTDIPTLEPSPTPTLTPTPYGYDPSWVPPWGVLTWDYSLLDKATEAGMHWIRVVVEWEQVEEIEGAYDWSKYDVIFDHIAATRLVPIVTIHSNPFWADADNNNCGPLNANGQQAWANFLRTMVGRYGPGTKYGVRHWEINNEVDLRYETWLKVYWPKRVGGIGCWGDMAPEYVKFLGIASEAIWEIDPDAVILMGSQALLNVTNMSFLNEVLIAGGAPYFDMIGFNMYYGQDLAWYTCADQDRSPGHICQSVMGMRGKARILHTMLNQHGVEKRVIVTETAFRCLHDYPNREPCTQDELQAAVAYVAKTHIWALVEEAYPIIWYTLNYPGFFHSSLLDKEGNPKAIYLAYQTMADELHWARYVQPMTAEELGDDRLEGYLFQVGERKKWVLWAKDNITLPVRFLASEQPGGVLRVVDVLGTERVLSDATDSQPADGWISLEVNSNPVYVNQAP